MSSSALFKKAFSALSLAKLFDERIKDTKAIGRDGTRMGSFERNKTSEIELISNRVGSGTYKFTRYKEKLVSKGATKSPRVLSIPTVRDRLTLRALCEFLARIYKDAAIRKPHSYIKSIRQRMQEVDPKSVFLRLDVESYYGSIDKGKLLKTLRRRLRTEHALDLVTKAINNPTLVKNQTESGIPQGLSISNILAAIYLAQCDQKMSKKWVYYRYVDDILIICSKEEVTRAYSEISAILKRRSLTTHPIGVSGSKSYIATLDEGVDYLGFHIAKPGISVRQSSYRKMFATLSSVLTDFRYKQREPRLIWRLNLKISGCRFEGKNYGWMFFFLQTEDIRQLARLDNFVRQQLVKRRMGHLVSRVKRFVKTYHEIRFNHEDTKYIPNFDNMSIDDMRMILREIRGLSQADLAHFSDEEVRSRFFSTIRHEVIELERDLFESIS